MSTPTIEIRKLNDTDKEWVTSLLKSEWGGTIMVSRGKVHHIDTHPGFVTLLNGERMGLITHEITGTECEITILQSLKEGIGIGRQLVTAVKELAQESGCSRVWLITTNDNLHALGFYQKIGFTLVAVYLNALEESRKFKNISRIGENGIPLRDEIELEIQLNTTN